MATRRLAWLTVALAGLLAVVGLASRAPRPFGVGGGTTGVGPSFFDYAFTTVVLVLGAELVLLVLAVVFEVHRRGKFEPPQRALWKQFAAIAIAILVVMALSRVHPLHPKPQSAGSAKLGSGLAEKERQARRVHGRNVRLKWEEVAIGGAIIAVLLVAGLVAGRRRGGGGPDGDRLLPAAAEVSEILDEALDDLRSSSDFRRAVIAAYARMEGALASHGLPRRRSEAPLEYVERALVHLRASRSSVRRLTDLFEWAKFSHHEVDAAMRDAAVDALVDVRDELQAVA